MQAGHQSDAIDFDLCLSLQGYTVFHLHETLLSSVEVTLLYAADLGSGGGIRTTRSLAYETSEDDHSSTPLLFIDLLIS